MSQPAVKQFNISHHQTVTKRVIITNLFTNWTKLAILASKAFPSEINNSNNETLLSEPTWHPLVVVRP